MDHLTVNRNTPSPTPSVGSNSSSNSITGVYMYRSRSFNFKRKKHTSSSICEKDIYDAAIALPNQSSEIDFEEEPTCLTNKEIKTTRPRCNTDPSKLTKNSRSGVLDKLVKHTINMKASPIAIAVRSPSPVSESIQQNKNFDLKNESSISYLDNENSSNKLYIDPKVYLQYLDQIPKVRRLKIHNLNKDDFSSFSDSNIDCSSSSSKKLIGSQPSSPKSKIKTGVKKSYSCIGKFSQSPEDDGNFYYKKIKDKIQQQQLEKKSSKFKDDISANESSSSDSQSSTKSFSPKLLRDKVTFNSNTIGLRPKSTPPLSTKPLISSTSSTSSSSSPRDEQNNELNDDDNGKNNNDNGTTSVPIIKRESFLRQSFNRIFRRNSATNPSSLTNSNSINGGSSNSSNSSCNSDSKLIQSSSVKERFFNSVNGIIDGSGISKKDKSKLDQKTINEINSDDLELVVDIVNSDYCIDLNDINNLENLDNKKLNNNKNKIKIHIEKIPSESDLSKLSENSNSTSTSSGKGIKKHNSFIVNTKRSTNNVNIGIRSTTDTTPMAPLQGQSETNGQSIINLSTLNKNHNHYQSSNNLNQNQNQTSNNINYNNNNNNNTSSNNFNTTTNSNLNTGTSSLKTDSKSQKQLSSSPIISSSETKQQQSTTTTTSSSSTSISASGSGSGQQQQQQQQQQFSSTQNNHQNQEKSVRSISPHPLKSQSTSSVLSVVNDTKSNSSVTTAKNEIPEKEKKRKELSSSRKKKFHRHFQQVSKDERVLNYFSCALVSDILLQGHLYITENYFAFYSNVFGFVTKLLIPTSSVVKISKEKTAKIIPNAVGVATIDERHVFGSFMSREAAYRLMCSVCPPLEPIENIIPKVPDAEICEEYSVEDDSSCSISGNESPAQLKAGDSGGNCGNTTASSDASHTLRHRIIPSSSTSTTAVIVSSDSIPDSDLLTVDGDGEEGKIQLILGAGTPIKVLKTNQTLPIITTATSTSVGFPLLPERNLTSSSYSIASLKSVKDKLISLINFKFPTEVHVVYIGVFLAVILTLFSLFLMYRILDIEAKASYRSTIDLSNKWSSSDDDNNNVYAEALKWQKELQAKSTEEAHNILSNNLELIARVRKSLKALSMLIHDRHPSSASSSSSAYYDNTNDDSILMEHDDNLTA